MKDATAIAIVGAGALLALAWIATSRIQAQAHVAAAHAKAPAQKVTIGTVIGAAVDTVRRIF